MCARRGLRRPLLLRVDASRTYRTCPPLPCVLYRYVPVRGWYSTQCASANPPSSSSVPPVQHQIACGRPPRLCPRAVNAVDLHSLCGAAKPAIMDERVLAMSSCDSEARPVNPRWERVLQVLEQLINCCDALGECALRPIGQRPRVQSVWLKRPFAFALD